MLRPQVQVLLVALFSSVLLVRVSSAPRRDMLTETLRADLANDKVSSSYILHCTDFEVAEMTVLKCILSSSPLPSVLLGSRSLALAEICVRTSERRRDAPRAAGRGDRSQGGGDAAAPSGRPKRAQGGLPQLLLEDVHLLLTQDESRSRCFYPYALNKFICDCSVCLNWIISLMVTNMQLFWEL